jgi:hypothetical protein
MDRRATLRALIQLDVPLSDLQIALAAFDWDAEPVVTLRRFDIAAILHRFASGEIDALTVEDWANRIECREDIRFEPDHEEIVSAALHDLANPVLQGRLDVIAPDVLATLT